MTSQTMAQTLKGFRDFVGSDAVKRQWLINSIAKTFRKFGYELLETPALEYEELLAGKYGDEADKLIYRFEDNGGRKVALRYDQTVPTARVIAQYQNNLTFPYKRYQMQPVWRADKPQKGRYREFLQCDADIIGSTSPLADAEVLAVYYQIYIDIGITSLKLKINDREQLIATISSAGVSNDMIFSTIQSIDKLDKKSEDDVIQELVRKGIDEDSANSLLQKLSNQTPSDKLKTIIDSASLLGVPKQTLEYAPTLARGLDYYTGMIFEGIIPEYTVGSVGGGGRYDNLIEDLVGVSQPAVGFGLGFDRTLEAAEELDIIPKLKTTTKVFVTIFSEELLNSSLACVQQLRNAGIATDCAVDLSQKIQKQLKYANKKNIPYVIVIGPEEERRNMLALKNMSSGEQNIVSIEEAIKTLQN